MTPRPKPKKGCNLDSIIADRRRKIVQNAQDYRLNETAKRRPVDSRNIT